jgi:hypothetical protein
MDGIGEIVDRNCDLACMAFGALRKTVSLVIRMMIK